MDGRFGHGRFGQDVLATDVLATDVLATYIEKTDVLAKSIIYVLIIDIKATNIFNLQTIFNKYLYTDGHGQLCRRFGSTL